jgi:hypothetical protein
MTIRIPKWLLAGIAMIAAVVVAFLVGERQGSAVEPTCSRAMAEKAVVASSFDDTIREQATAQARLAGYAPTSVPFFTNVPTDYQVAWLHCRDVTGDGADEMIVGLGAGAASRTFQWAIFTAGDEGQWDLAFDREGSLVSSIRIRPGGVVVQTPTYGREDALCCPSGYKSTRVVYQDGSFEVSSGAISSQREVVLTDGQVVGIGPLDALRDSPVQAFAELGAPTSIGGDSGSLCEYDWSDLGLSIDFANFGGGDPCGSDGRIASFELIGAPAAQAGWEIDGGAEVGMDLSALWHLYPGFREGDRELVLVETPSPFGAGGTLAVMTGFVGGGKVWAYRFYVGAAGE